MHITEYNMLLQRKPHAGMQVPAAENPKCAASYDDALHDIDEFHAKTQTCPGLQADSNAALLLIRLRFRWILFVSNNRNIQQYAHQFAVFS